MDSSSNNAAKTRGRPFEKGNAYGQGRPAGSRNRATLLLEALIDGEGEELVQTIVTPLLDFILDERRHMNWLNERHGK